MIRGRAVVGFVEEIMTARFECPGAAMTAGGVKKLLQKG